MCVCVLRVLCVFVGICDFHVAIALLTFFTFLTQRQREIAENVGKVRHDHFGRIVLLLVFNSRFQHLFFFPKINFKVSAGGSSEATVAAALAFASQKLSGTC